MRTSEQANKRTNNNTNNHNNNNNNSMLHHNTILPRCPPAGPSPCCPPRPSSSAPWSTWSGPTGACPGWRWGTRKYLLQRGKYFILLSERGGESAEHGAVAPRRPDRAGLGHQAREQHLHRLEGGSQQSDLQSAITCTFVISPYLFVQLLYQYQHYISSISINTYCINCICFNGHYRHRTVPHPLH